MRTIRPMMLAATDMSTPMFWALMIGWILTVVLHEFAHGIVAWWGGDYTIRQRGGLTLNPLQYLDPLFSLVMPAIFLLMGGIPLPGGSTYVRRDLLRSPGWETAMSLAGPGMNLLIFLACALPLHPRVGWADYLLPVELWSNGQHFLAALATLQFTAVRLNLVPVPPLDGFQAISPYMDEEARAKISGPPIGPMLMIGFFILVWRVPAVMLAMQYVLDRALIGLGFGENGIYYFWNSLRVALYGS